MINHRRLIKSVLARVVPSSVYYSINAVVAARDIAKGRRWEAELDSLAHYVHPGDMVVDVGANHGLYAYALSKLVGPTGLVHAFEPMPPNLRILRHTVGSLKLSNVEIHPVACGEQTGTTTFCIPVSRGVPQLGWARQGTEGKMFSCKVVCLDEVIRDKITFLKCDIEGAELFALRGASRILESWHPAILLEAENHTAQFGYQEQVIFDFLRSIGYRVLKGNLEPCERFSEPGNYFFLHSRYKSF